MTTLPLRAASPAHRVTPGATHAIPFLAATSLTFLKPRLKMWLWPVSSTLAAIGVTANQVTLTSLVGSVLVGVLLCAYPTHTALFVLLPIWLVVRAACAAIDGTLAIEFGQKSRMGGVLNETGDIISDAALFLPLAFVAPLTIGLIVGLIILSALSEIAGIVGPSLGSGRRLEGPLGKADRAILLAVSGMVIAVLGRLPQGAQFLIPFLYCSLVLTIWNRLHFAFVERSKTAE